AAMKLELYWFGKYPLSPLGRFLPGGGLERGISAVPDLANRSYRGGGSSAFSFAIFRSRLWATPRIVSRARLAIEAGRTRSAFSGAESSGGETSFRAGSVPAWWPVRAKAADQCPSRTGDTASDGA